MLPSFTGYILISNATVSDLQCRYEIKLCLIMFLLCINLCRQSQNSYTIFDFCNRDDGWSLLFLCHSTVECIFARKVSDWWFFTRWTFGMGRCLYFWNISRRKKIIIKKNILFWDKQMTCHLKCICYLFIFWKYSLSNLKNSDIWICSSNTGHTLYGIRSVFYPLLKV